MHRTGTHLKSTAIRDAILKLGMTEGWSQSLERLAKCVAKSVAKSKRYMLVGKKDE